MLDYLVQHAPAGVSRTDLAVAAGLSARGGAFRRYLKLLTTKKLASWSDGKIALNPAITHQSAA
jgi:hypothetical protein